MTTPEPESIAEGIKEGSEKTGLRGQLTDLALDIKEAVTMDGSTIDVPGALKRYMSGEETTEVEPDPDLEDQATESKESHEKKEEPDETSWMTTGARLALLGVGIYGGFKLVSWLKSKLMPKDANDKQAFPWVPATVGLMAVGAYLGEDQIQDWAEKNMGLSIREKSFEKFLNHMKNGEISQAFNSFSLESSEPGIVKASRKLDVPKKVLIELKNTKYSTFFTFRKNTSNQALSYVKYAMDKLGINLDMPMVTDTGDVLELAEQERALYQYIDKHIDTLRKLDPNIENKTIGVILEQLVEKGILE